MGPTSSEPHYASTSGETRQLAPLVIVPNQLPDQSEMPSERQKSNIRRRWWWHGRYILALFRDAYSQHKREKPLGAGPGIRQSIIAIFKYSWLNVLLIFMPLSWIFHYVKLSETLVFVCSFLAIVPLANLLDFATDDLSLRFGETIAGLFAFTLDNTVELTVAIIALVKCELAVVQSSLVGSLLSNLLLVLGMCFFVGGTRFSEQGFGIGAAHQNSYLLTLSVIAVLLPAAFHNVVQSTGGVNPLTSEQDGHDILSISHGVAVILLFIYLCYLVFQLFSHKNIYDDDHADVQQSVQYPPRIAKRLHIYGSAPSSSSPPPIDGMMVTAQPDVSLETGWDSEEEVEIPQIHLQTAIALHVILTALIAVTAEFLVDSIDGLTSSGHISKGFVGLILLPILGSAAKQINAVAVSVKDRIALSLKVAVGSSLQLALFVIPFIVTLGWILGKPMTLLFDPFESIVLFFSVLTFNYVVQDGKSNWLSGMILICLYAIIAVTIWYYPVSDPAGLLATCK